MPSTGAGLGGARATTRPTSGKPPEHGEVRAGSATATWRTIALPAHPSVVVRFGRARTGRWDPAGSCRAAPASADAAALAGVALGRAAREPPVSALLAHALEGSGLAAPAPADFRLVVPAQEARAPGRRARAAARATTTAVRPGGTATRAIDGRRRAEIAMRVIVGRRYGAHRSARGATLVTTTAPRRDAQRRPATCCTAATPSWRRSGPAVRSDG